MKKYTLYILISLLAVVLSSCQNNGDIGYLYGVWGLDSYTVDGQELHDKYIDNTTFSFQSDIVEVVSQYDDYMSAYMSYGTWEWGSGDTLMFNFMHHDDTGIYESQYQAPAWIGFTSGELMMMQVNGLSGSRMTLSWQHEGKSYVYRLKKMD